MKAIQKSINVGRICWTRSSTAVADRLRDASCHWIYIIQRQITWKWYKIELQCRAIRTMADQ